MTDTTFTTRPAAIPRGRVSAAARAVLELLPRLAHGTLDLQLPDGSSARYGTTRGDGEHAALRLLDWQVCSATLARGDIGFAEAYLEGRWTSPDLAALLRLLLRNREAIESLVYGSWWGALAYRVRHWLHRNTRAGSRRNIHAHYDLGNNFYRLWLDETLNYSSALFDGNFSLTMAQAQNAKMQRALDACVMAPGARLLEIGCGWGAVAELALRQSPGLHYTGVTLSTEQLAQVQERLAFVGARADARLQDYRDIPLGPNARGYDAIVSIEMFEAVGREYWGDYFAALRRLLEPGGRACIQSIVIRDDLFERYARSTDFIQQYIFPGGLLPCPAAFRAEAARAGLEVVDEFAFGRDYAETLRRWRRDFQARAAEVRGLGFDERFMRLWEFYLAYCEAAFDSGSTDVVQFTLRRPQ